MRTFQIQFNSGQIYMPVVNLTQKSLSSLTCPPGKARIEYCCADLPGLLLEVRSTQSSPTWYVRSRSPSSGKTQYHRIGHANTLSLVQAKKAALQLKAEIQRGRDPRAETKKQKEVPTLREFVDEQYIPYIKTRKRSWLDDRGRLYHRLLPVFGDLRLNAISRKGLIDFSSRLKEEEGLAGASCDHYLKLMRRIYNLGIQWNVVDKNPLERIQLFNEPNEINPSLSDDQLKKLLIVLHTHKNRRACQVALLGLSTGARLNELLTCSWESIDLTNFTWKVHSTNSKNFKSRLIPLNESAVSVLNQIQPDEKLREGFVFMNERSGQRLKTVHKAWGVIRKEAGVPFLRLHDLRHLFCTFCVESGLSLYTVAQLAGHTNPSITQRYAHIAPPCFTSSIKNRLGPHPSSLPSVAPLPYGLRR